MPETSRRERRKAFTTDQRVALLEDDADETERRHDEIKKSLGRLTGAALGLMISVLTGTIMLAITLGTR